MIAMVIKKKPKNDKFENCLKILWQISIWIQSKLWIFFYCLIIIDNMMTWFEWNDAFSEIFVLAIIWTPYNGERVQNLNNT